MNADGKTSLESQQKLVLAGCHPERSEGTLERIARGPSGYLRMTTPRANALSLIRVHPCPSVVGFSRSKFDETYAHSPNLPRRVDCRRRSAARVHAVEGTCRRRRGRFCPAL